MEKQSFSLKLLFGEFYGQSFIKTVRGPLLLLFTFYYKYLKYKNIFSLGIKSVLYLKYNRIDGFVGV